MNVWDKLRGKRNIPLPPAAPAQPRKEKKIGLALGGGGLKGTAHIGVLKVLAEYDIPIHMVAGTSVGSAIAALYAAGYDWKMMYRLFTEFDIDGLIKVRPSRMGLVPASGYTDLIRACTKNRRIEEMDIPLKIVAVDLVSRKKIVFDRGDTALAVRASSAVPGVFTPVPMGDMLLVDGYVLDNCPGGVVREMGADVVIAVSLHTPDTSTPGNMLEIVNRALDIAAVSYQQIDGDIVLKPITAYKNFLNKEVMGECFALGEECARRQIDDIIKLTKG